MQQIAPILWFDGKALDAAKFYVSVFKNSKLASLSKGPDGKVFGATFHLDGHDFMALNGGPKTMTASFHVGCKNQKEVDYYWKKLSHRGAELNSGWVRDQFGISWQIIPDALSGLLTQNDRAKATRVQQAMIRMKKVDLKALQAVSKGVAAKKPAKRK